MRTVRKSFDTVTAGIAHIRQAWESNPGAPAGTVGSLLLTEIIVCETVFQRRNTMTNRHGRQEHVRDLKRAIRDNPEAMEPVDVWWGGDGWYLLDGHHRVLAYEALGFTQEVSVRVIGGTLDDALAHVGRANTRNKLPMSSEERNDLAVFFVCMFPEKSLREIAEMSGVGKSNVGTMKKTVSQLEQMGHPRESLLGVPWHEIRWMARGEISSEYDHDGKVREVAHEIRKVLGPILGKNPQRHIEAVAIALEGISPALYRGLMDWGSAEEELEGDPEGYAEY